MQREALRDLGLSDGLFIEKIGDKKVLETIRDLMSGKKKFLEKRFIFYDHQKFRICRMLELVDNESDLWDAALAPSNEQIVVSGTLEVAPPPQPPPPPSDEVESSDAKKVDSSQIASKNDASKTPEIEILADNKMSWDNFSDGEEAGSSRVKKAKK